MKQILLFIFSLLSLTSWTQISYQSSSFASIGSSYLVSNTTAALSGIDFVQTGASYAWDYSALQANTQETVKSTS